MFMLQYQNQNQKSEIALFRQMYNVQCTFDLVTAPQSNKITN